MALKVIRVELGDRSYEIQVGRMILDQMGQRLADLCGPRKVALVTDANVEPLYGPLVADSLRRSGFAVSAIVLPPGEEQKTLDTAKSLYDRFIDFGVDRKSLIVALGGGVIGDLAGFAAATFMRGIPFVQVPTTLLAQVDSSVGGKTAVDHAKGKNLIGAFHQPIAVFIDTEVLRSLPVEEFHSGLVEVIKHGFIRSEKLLRFIADHSEKIEALDPEVMIHAVSASVQIKADVVGQDEKEEGLRAILNYGHTLGHALESVTRYSTYRHGEAVSIGMVFAARIARAMGLLKEKDVNRHEHILARFGLPVRLAGEDREQILAQFYRDKKALSGKLRWVLLRRIGEAVIRDDVPEPIVRQALSEISP